MFVVVVACAVGMLADGYMHTSTREARTVHIFYVKGGYLSVRGDYGTWLLSPVVEPFYKSMATSYFIVC